MSLLPKNPIAVEGRIEKCWLFAYRTPLRVARSLLPDPLEPVDIGGFGFLNIVVCEVAAMRPAGFPASLGLRYRHAASRVYAKFRPQGWRDDMRGLYFLRNDCDSGLMAAGGRAFSQFGFHASPIDIMDDLGDRGEALLSVGHGAGLGEALVDHSRRPELGWQSPFSGVGEAAAHLKYEPNALFVDQPGAVNAISIAREESAWRYRLAHVQYATWSYLKGIPAELEVCYEVDPIDYRWNRGRTLFAEGYQAPSPGLVGGELARLRV